MANKKQERVKVLTIKLEDSSRMSDVKELIVDSLGAALKTGAARGETTITARFLYKKSAEKALNRVAQILSSEGVSAEVDLQEL